MEAVGEFDDKTSILFKEYFYGSIIKLGGTVSLK